MSIAVSSYRYRSRRSDASLPDQLVWLAREKPRYGIGDCRCLVEREGERVNHKRLWRVYREAGLCLKRKDPKFHDGEFSTLSSPRNPRNNNRALGGTRHYHKARLQWACVPLRVAGYGSDKALQSLGSALRASTELQKRERINPFGSNRKRCSVKPVSSARGSIPGRRSRAC